MTAARLGMQIRRQRLAARLWLSDVSAATGIHESRLCRIETGKARAYADEVDRIQRALKGKTRKWPSKQRA